MASANGNTENVNMASTNEDTTANVGTINDGATTNDGTTTNGDTENVDMASTDETPTAEDIANYVKSMQERLVSTRERYEQEGYHNVSVVTVITREAYIPATDEFPTGRQTQCLVLQPRTSLGYYFMVGNRAVIPQEVVPSGELKAGETVRDALPRVVREATGLAITEEVTSLGSMSSMSNIKKDATGDSTDRDWIRSNKLIYRVRIEGDGEHFFFDDDKFIGGLWITKGMLDDDEIDVADNMERFVKDALC